MVFFICNHCGDSLKKQVVEKHAWKCRRDINVSCMDCLKDFPGKSYDAHTSCISEAEKYSGKDYVPKPSANKGAKKQESWVATVRAITEKKRNMPYGMMKVFDVIKQNDNIPKKMKGFVNFFQNSARHIPERDVQAAWALIEEEVNRSKQQQQPPTNNGQQKPVEQPKGTEEYNGAAPKRKVDEKEEEPSKKRKKKSITNGNHDEEDSTLLNEEKNGQDQDINGDSNESQKFRWIEVIRDSLISKNNQMMLTKLKKKVLKQYRQHGGNGCDEQLFDAKLEKKFNKKLQKANVVVENDTVRLIA